MDASEKIVLGHGSHRYHLDYHWGQLDASKTPVNDCHEMVMDSRKRIILLTNETRNNIIIYDKSGKLLETWGSEYPGAHGLTLWNGGDEDFLFICDYERHEVIKTTVSGQVLMTLPCPMESGKYASPDQYRPTETAVAANGDIYVADGYGEQYIIQYNHKGELIRIFGGRGDNEDQFHNAHGICIDDRQKDAPTLLITARQQNCLKRFTLDGQYISTIHLPGAYICRPVIDDKNVYLAVLISKMPWDSQSGFVLVLDENDRLVSNIGGSVPLYEDGKLQQLHQVVRVLKHPHDVCIDNDKNLYVAQWLSGKIYPIKLNRI